MIKNVDNKFYPLVSIIIPVYNGANFVKEAIDSALAQTYTNIEIIVVNDGSTDNTEEIVKKYGNKLRYFKKENGGVATALNLGIENAKGEYISWLSHDDLYSKEKISINIDALSKLSESKRQNTILYSNIFVIDEKTNIIRETCFQNQHSVKKLNSAFYPLFNGIINGCTLFTPKKCFTETEKFDSRLKVTQDYDLWFKMFPHYDIVFIPDLTVKSREHINQGTKQLYALVECNKLWTRMIKNMDREQILLIWGGIMNFYNNVLEIVTAAKYYDTRKYLENEIIKYKTRDVLHLFVYRVELLARKMKRIIFLNYNKLVFILIRISHKIFLFWPPYRKLQTIKDLINSNNAKVDKIAEQINQILLNRNHNDK